MNMHTYTVEAARVAINCKSMKHAEYVYSINHRAKLLVDYEVIKEK